MSELTIEEIIGNEDIKTQLKISLGAAKKNNKPLPHMLFCGSAGCGKTSLSRAVAVMGEMPFLELSPDALKNSEDLASLFDKLPTEGYDKITGEIIGQINPAILFVDEAHRLSLKAEEMLGIAMESWRHTYIVKRGRGKEAITSFVPRFTLICATTMEGLLSKPFRDRFKVSHIFKEYSLGEAIAILYRHAQKKNLTVSQDAAVRIAQRSRGVPRLVVRYLEAVADAMTYLGKETIEVGLAEAQFQLMKIDPEGLSETDITILKTLHESELPVGIDTLSLITNQDKATIAEVNEPYLVRLGFIERSKQGRLITDKGITHLVEYKYIEPIKGPSRVLSRERIL